MVSSPNFPSSLVSTKPSRFSRNAFYIVNSIQSDHRGVPSLEDLMKRTGIIKYLSDITYIQLTYLEFPTCPKTFQLDLKLFPVTSSPYRPYHSTSSTTVLPSDETTLTSLHHLHSHFTFNPYKTLITFTKVTI